ncbi:MAG TPA: hypothetical protein VGO93_07650 [Candidatus Xenobia bacterium]|jgi:hypothetical protein
MKSWLLALAFLFLPLQAQAQLVSVDKNYRITRVDYAENRIEVQYLNGKTVTLFVDIDGNTQVLLRRRPLYWKRLQKGWIVQVKGGLEFGGHIKGKTIIVHST